MPKGGPDGRRERFQFWANLPRTHMMMDPKYRDIKSRDVPEVKMENGSMIKVICGRVRDVQAPVKDIVIDPEYLDVTVPANTEFIHATKQGHTVFAMFLMVKAI
jgi:redox-sensitive bicupin YhaK (pirin superfamily)